MHQLNGLQCFELLLPFHSFEFYTEGTAHEADLWVLAAVLVLLSGCLLSAIVQQFMTMCVHGHRRKHHA